MRWCVFSLACTGVCWHFAGMRRCVVAYAGVCGRVVTWGGVWRQWRVLMCWRVSPWAGLCWRVLACGGVCLHVLACARDTPDAATQPNSETNTRRAEEWRSNVTIDWGRVQERRGRDPNMGNVDGKKLFDRSFLSLFWWKVCVPTKRTYGLTTVSWNNKKKGKETNLYMTTIQTG